MGYNSIYNVDFCSNRSKPPADIYLIYKESKEMLEFIKNYKKNFCPKLVEILAKGYSLDLFKKDCVSGITVAVISIPLAMALAIASGVSPAQGLYTAIVAGFFIALLGGSRYQIGGPTGAFVVVIFNVMANYGYQGLAAAKIGRAHV